MPLKVERVAISSLTPDPENPRTHDDVNRATIRTSLRQFGQVEPLIVRAENRQVVAGNARMGVMLEEGWTECDVVFLSLDEEKARALSIALNRTGELGGWDPEVLAGLAADYGDMLSGYFSDEALQDALSGFVIPLDASAVLPVPEAGAAPPVLGTGAAGASAGERLNIGSLDSQRPTEGYLSNSIKKFEFYVPKGDYERVRLQLEAVRKDLGVGNNSLAILYLLSDYHERKQA